jgi:hypothetical protein
MAKKSVKVLPNVPDNKLRQKIMNAQREAAAVNAKSGLTAERLGGLIEEKNKKPAKVVKVNSATPKRQGTTPTPRTKGGLMIGAGAGNWRNMFK